MDKYDVFPGGSVVKNLPANARDSGDMGFPPGLERILGGGNGNPLQYSCLENPMDRGAWRATGHWVTESDTTEQLSIFDNLSQTMVSPSIVTWPNASALQTHYHFPNTQFYCFLSGLLK